MHPDKRPIRRHPIPGLLPGIVLALACLQVPLADSAPVPTRATAKPGTLAGANGAGQPPLGRLFFTAAQRQALDLLRREGAGDIPDTPTTASPALVDAAARGLGLRDVVVHGVVTSRHGQPSTWVTGPAQPLPDAKLSGERVPVLLPDNGEVFILKVGQRYRARDGAIVEGSTASELPLPDTSPSTDRPTAASIGDDTAEQALPLAAGQPQDGDPGDNPP